MRVGGVAAGGLSLVASMSVTITFWISRWAVGFQSRAVSWLVSQLLLRCLPPRGYGGGVCSAVFSGAHISGSDTAGSRRMQVMSYGCGAMWVREGVCR